MDEDNRGKSDYSAKNCTTVEINSSTELAGILRSLRSPLTQLVTASKAQTEAFNNLREDILLQPDRYAEMTKTVFQLGTPTRWA